MDAQVLHDGEAAQLRHRIGQVTGGPWTVAQQVEQLPTLRAGQHPPDISCFAVVPLGFLSR